MYLKEVQVKLEEEVKERRKIVTEMSVRQIEI